MGNGQGTRLQCRPLEPSHTGRVPHLLPGGTTGTGFILWNLGFAVLLMFAVPLIRGLRDLPKVLRIYRFIYRYPKPGELDQPALRERHGPVHGGPES